MPRVDSSPCPCWPSWLPSPATLLPPLLCPCPDAELVDQLEPWVRVLKILLGFSRSAALEDDGDGLSVGSLPEVRLLVRWRDDAEPGAETRRPWALMSVLEISKDCALREGRVSSDGFWRCMVGVPNERRGVAPRTPLLLDPTPIVEAVSLDIGVWKVERGVPSICTLCRRTLRDAAMLSGVLLLTSGCISAAAVLCGPAGFGEGGTDVEEAGTIRVLVAIGVVLLSSKRLLLDPRRRFFRHSKAISATAFSSRSLRRYCRTIHTYPEACLDFVGVVVPPADAALASKELLAAVRLSIGDWVLLLSPLPSLVGSEDLSLNKGTTGMPDSVFAVASREPPLAGEDDEASPLPGPLESERTVRRSDERD